MSYQEILTGLGAPSLLCAANIAISSDPSGVITISWADFENGFSVNGTFYRFVDYGVAQTVTFTPTIEQRILRCLPI